MPLPSLLRVSLISSFFLLSSLPSHSSANWWGLSSLLLSGRYNRVQVTGRQFYQLTRTLMRNCQIEQRLAYSKHPLPMVMNDLLGKQFDHWYAQHLYFSGLQVGRWDLGKPPDYVLDTEHIRYAPSNCHVDQDAKNEASQAGNEVLSSIRHYQAIESSICLHMMQKFAALTALEQVAPVMNLSYVNDTLTITEITVRTPLNLEDIRVWVVVHRSSVFSNCVASASLFVVLLLRTPLGRVLCCRPRGKVGILSR
ncbi:GP2 [Praja virus]|nr:GP2 [Praja virus]